MPSSATLVLDEVRDAELESDGINTRYIRTGHIDNMDLADVPDPDALVKCMNVQGMPLWRSQLSANSPGLILQRMRIKPEPLKVRRVNVWLVYETSTLDFTPTAYILRDRTFTMDYEGYFIPGTRVPVMVGFDTSGLDSSLVGLQMPKRPLLFRSSISAKSIQLTTLQYGRPNGGAGDYVNYLNDASWPNLSEVQLFNSSFNSLGGNTTPSTPVKTATAKPAAYWKLQNYSTDYDAQRGMTLTSAEATTKGIEDWSQVGMQVNDQGKYPFASVDDATRLSLLTTMASRDYAYGLIYPVGLELHRGLVRFGEFPMTSFPSLFGF